MAIYDTPEFGFQEVGAGIRSDFGMLLPPGGRIVAYVHHSGHVDGMPPEIDQLIVTTLNAGLARARSGKQDIVVVLPGHSENIATADAMSSLVAGTQIVGWGRGSARPTLRWTATDATFLLDVADVLLRGLRLRMEGANGVVAPITVSAADCAITDCDIEVCSGASNKATTPITVTASGHRFQFVHNVMRGTTDAATTNGISVTGAAHDVEIAYNRMFFSGHATNGLVNIAAASLRLDIHHNRMFNTTTNAEFCILLGDAASSGFITDNRFAGVKSGTAAAEGISFGSSTLVVCAENYNVDEVKKSGVLAPAAAS